MTYGHHPVDRTTNHMFKYGLRADRPMVPVIFRVAVDTEITIITGLVAIDSSHNYFPVVRFLVPLVFFTIVSFGITDISLWIVCM